MIIILRGHTGSGKSTLMNSLTSIEELGFKSIEVDALKEIDPNTPYKLAAQKLESCKKKGQSNIIVEGAFNPQNRIDEFFNETSLNTKSEDLLIIRLKCTLDTAISRKQNLTIEVVTGQVNKEWVEIEGEHIIITEKKSRSTVLNEVVELIKSR